MIVGITGRIATGKSTVAGLLAENGFMRIDADGIYNDLRKKSLEMNNEILKRFNSLDNARILAIINDDKNALADLNTITHKYVVAEILYIINENKDKNLVLDVPVPVKTGFLDIAEYIIVTTCSRENQIKRLIERDKCDEKNALLKINMQMSDKEYCALGHLIINTDNLASQELKNILINTCSFL